MNCQICNHLMLPWCEHVLKCSRCGHGIRTDKAPEYDEEYRKKREKTQSLRDNQQCADNFFLMEYIDPNKINVETFEILDFGAGDGNFTSYVRGSYKYADEYELGDPWPTKQYDLVILRGVIEHLLSFEALFSLQPKYFYICATPDFNSPCAIQYGPDWNQLSPYHRHNFTAASLALLMRKYGYGLLGLHYPYIETPYRKNTDQQDFINKNPGHAYPGTMMSAICTRQ